jgi:hypothetical protein
LRLPGICVSMGYHFFCRQAYGRTRDSESATGNCRK